MDHRDSLAPCLISKGTVSHPRDMLRALETLENLDYRYVVAGELIEEGRAALVKLMADPESATLIVNGCLFLNVSSFRYLDFEQAADERWRFVLHGDQLAARAPLDSRDRGRGRGRQAPPSPLRGDRG